MSKGNQENRNIIPLSYDRFLSDFENDPDYLVFLSNIELINILSPTEDLNFVLYKNTIEQMVNPIEINDYIQHHAAEINAINYQFFNIMDEEQKKAQKIKIGRLLLALLISKERRDFYHLADEELELRCKALLKILKNSDIEGAKKSLSKKPIENPVDLLIDKTISFCQNVSDWVNNFHKEPALKLYQLCLNMEEGLAFIHGNRIEWSFDDTTAIYATAQFDPNYNAKLAKENLDKMDQVAGQLSWIVPSLAVLTNAFKLGIKAKTFYQKKSSSIEAENATDTNLWFIDFIKTLPQPIVMEMTKNIIWSMVNTVSFWLNFGLGKDTIIAGKMSANDFGTVLSILGMLYELALQIQQLVGFYKELQQKEALLKAVDHDLPINRKKLIAEIRQLNLQSKALIGEILTITSGIILGMTLMCFGPFAPALPVIGCIVNSVAMLLFIIVQHSIKIYDSISYKNCLEKELKDKKREFNALIDKSQERILFLEILELENDLKTQEYLVKMQGMILVRTVILKLCLQVVIFFTISFGSLTIALINIGMGILEKKLTELITDYFLFSPPSISHLPELNGGYLACSSVAEVTEKQLYIDRSRAQENFIDVHYISQRNEELNTKLSIEILKDKDTVKIYYSLDNMPCIHEFDKNELQKINCNFQDIIASDYEKSFTQILKLTSFLNLTPGGDAFEKSFEQFKSRMRSENREGEGKGEAVSVALKG